MHFVIILKILLCDLKAPISMEDNNKKDDSNK